MHPKTIAIIGMGTSGLAATELALFLGHTVYCVDENIHAPHIDGTTSFYGQEAMSTIAPCDIMVLSPGVPSWHKMVVWAKEHAIPILSELEFACQFCHVPIIAITGTNGKSSTAWYTHQLATAMGLNSWIGGNFGIAVSKLALDILRDKIEYDVVVIEVSSYQLEFSPNFHPQAASIINLTPDHLARHKTMEEYLRCKRMIFAHMNAKELLIVPQADSRLHPPADTVSVAYFQDADTIEANSHDGAIIYGDRTEISWKEHRLCIPHSSVQIFGHHNYENISIATLLMLGILPHLSNKRVPPVIETSMFSTITALEHRLEAFYHDNITWINDSKATNIEATIAGVQSLEKIHVLLLGGAGKEGANYSMLQDLLEKKCTNVICFGASGTEIFNSLSTLSSIYKTIDLASAIELANKISDRGDIILLSPACASFDEFSNFGHRGKVFTAHVRSLPLTRGDS